MNLQIKNWFSFDSLAQDTKILDVLITVCMLYLNGPSNPGGEPGRHTTKRDKDNSGFARLAHKYPTWPLLRSIHPDISDPPAVTLE